MQWMDVEEDRPPLHLVFIEEPEATMAEYLADKVLRDEFALRYYVLDRAQFNDGYEANTDYSPQLLTPEKGSSGKDVLSRLLRIDVLNAQRHLSDKAGGHRAEDLSRHLGRFYSRNLKKREEDHDAKLTHCDLFFADAGKTRPRYQYLRLPDESRRRIWDSLGTTSAGIGQARSAE